MVEKPAAIVPIVVPVNGTETIDEAIDDGGDEWQVCAQILTTTLEYHLNNTFSRFFIHSVDWQS